MKNMFSKLKKQWMCFIDQVNIFLLFILVVFFLIFINDRVSIYSYKDVIHFDPSLFQNTILGILALLVPVGISILDSFFKKRARDDIDSNLELFILLKTVLQADKIAIFSFLTLFILSLYTISNDIIKLLALICFTIYSIWIFSYPLKDIWKWFFKDNKDFAIKFLENLKFEKDENIIISSWKSLWIGDNIKNNYSIEKKYTEIFINNIDHYIKESKKFSIVKDLLDTYFSKINNRKIIPKIIIVKLFEYIYNFWHQYQESAENKENASKSIELYEIYIISEEVLIKILQKSLQDPHPVSVTIDFFEVLDRHLQEHKDKVIQFKGKDKNYLEFFKYFGQRVITEILNMPDEYSARDVLEYQWSKSDRNWQINLSNLQSEEDNKITDYWLNIILEYIYETWKEQVFYNSYKKLEFKDIRKVNILINAFVPNINPILFIRVLELIWFKRVVKDNVKEYLKKQVFWGIISNIDEIEINNTIGLLKQIYKLDDNFYKDIQSQIKDIDLDTLDDEQKERLNRLQKIINYFKDIK
jgi:hypothetical protein